MAKYIIDTQLPPRLAKFLVKQGYDAIHTTFYKNGHLLKDAEIRKIALKENRVIITKDIDFFDSYLVKGYPPAVLLLKFGNIINSRLLNLFDKNFEFINEKFETNIELISFSHNLISEYKL